MISKLFGREVISNEDADVTTADVQVCIASLHTPLRPSVMQASPLFLSILSDRLGVHVCSLTQKVHPYHTLKLRDMKLYRENGVDFNGRDAPSKRHPMYLMHGNPGEDKKTTPFWFMKYLGAFKHTQDGKTVS